MIDVTDNISTSGFVPSSEYVVSGQFSNFLELSSRGYCRLYKAQRNGQWFTLKTLKSEVANDPMYQGMLDKEFNLMMQLNHPNVVRVYSREEIPNFGPCIVMEYIDGRTLGDFLSENRRRVCGSRWCGSCWKPSATVTGSRSYTATSSHPTFW